MCVCGVVYSECVCASTRVCVSGWIGRCGVNVSVRHSGKSWMVCLWVLGAEVVTGRDGIMGR